MLNFFHKIFGLEQKPKKEDPLDNFSKVISYTSQIQVKIAQTQGKLAQLKLRNLQTPVTPEELKEFEKEIEKDHAEIELMTAKLKEMIYSQP